MEETLRQAFGSDVVKIKEYLQKEEIDEIALEDGTRLKTKELIEKS